MNSTLKTKPVNKGLLLEKGRFAMIVVLAFIFCMLTKEILSLQHPLVKDLKKLRQNKSYREEKQTVVFTGLNALKELAQKFTFEKLLIQKGFTLPFKARAKETYIVSEEILTKITGMKNPEEVAVELLMPKPSDLLASERVLLLDGISDPGNMGTLLRAAHAFGWSVFVMEGSVDLFNDKAIRASKGALFSLQFDSGTKDKLEALLSKKPWQLFAADPKGDPLRQKIQGPLILAIGNESKGLSPYVEKRFKKIAIPMKSHTESLNAAVAGGILLYLLQDPL
jgi:TrmH family RNA methyltransferase